MLCYIACFPTLPYSCGFGSSKPPPGRPCRRQDQLLYELSTKVNCGLNVGTDMLSEFLFETLRCVNDGADGCYKVMTIPMLILWRSKIAWRQKVALGCVFGLVVFTMVVAIVRVKLTITGKAMNLPWQFVWCLVEANAGKFISPLHPNTGR
jgi:hypothetical protein